MTNAMPAFAKTPLIINLMAGAGAGKSGLAKLASGILACQSSPYTVELCTEFAKDLVWEGAVSGLENQIYVLGVQAHRIERLVGKADIIVTDSPTILSSVYCPPNYPRGMVTDMALWFFRRYPSINVFVQRTQDPYEAIGRVHDAEQALQKDREIHDLLRRHQITPVHTMRSTLEDAQKLAAMAMERMREIRSQAA